MNKKVLVTLLLMLFQLSAVNVLAIEYCDPELDPECPCRTEICRPNQDACPLPTVCPTALPSVCPPEGGRFCVEQQISCDDGCRTRRVTIAEISECEPECIPDYGSCPRPSVCEAGLPSTCPPEGGQYCVQETVDCTDVNECADPRRVSVARYYECSPPPTPTPTPLEDLDLRRPLLIQ